MRRTVLGFVVLSLCVVALSFITLVSGPVDVSMGELLDSRIFGQREPVAVHAVRLRGHKGIRRGSRPRMAGSTIQADRISMQGVIKGYRAYGTFRNARLPHQEIHQEKCKDHAEHQRRYSERTILE